MNKVSVLMPAYNAERFILKSVNAILAQTHTELELLICDDCSTDATFQLLSSLTDKRIKLYKNSENLGYLKTCNKLAGLSNGDFITFQDADDDAAPCRLEMLVTALKTQDWDLVGSNVNYINAKDDIIGRSYYALKVTQSLLIESSLPFCGSSVLCKRKVYSDIGLYDESFDRLGAEDYDWIYRAALKFKLGNIEIPLYYYRMHPSSVSNVTSLKVSAQLFTEHMAKQLFIERKERKLAGTTLEFIEEQKSYWDAYLAIDKTPILLKKASINALSGNRISNIKILFQLLACRSKILTKVRAIALVFLELVLGYGKLFKLKTFYKKLFYKHKGIRNS